MVAGRPKYLALLLLALVAWILVGLSLAYLAAPTSDRFGRPCGRALFPVGEVRFDDDSYLDVCTDLTQHRADMGWTFAIALAVGAVAASAAAVAGRRRLPWPAFTDTSGTTGAGC